ncbi:hypothetical protein EKN56_10550 [Limnobaculum zhutongyuii]|uniref:Restriction alleviation protein, Lar family n=1 Tax=Limnobaculum zhutongyuii TaxID=2498113 RepID=A0A411WKX9_9GAMM|nr:Lar family restriction alleviation protein [Limnobaculum zhutongyuii]QBH96808.1 hypothetical protein EKN56_10550 [Limnobaculum zhutongyuii]TQS90161.1 hypothetical protein ELQ32_02040 [Limnobaculum zhutongyuii]
MNTNLLPCPFCGRNKIVLWTSAFGDGSYATCGFCNTTRSGRTKQQATENWNHRAVNHSVPTNSPLSHLLLLLQAELERAVTVHSQWPTDAIHASAILNEEVGELTQAAIDFHFYFDGHQRLREEAIQVGAMALRFLLNIDSYKPEGKS